MSKRVIAIVAIVAVAIVAIAVIVARPSKPEPDATSAAAPAVGGETLQVWIGGDKAYNGLAEVGKRFTEETGIEVIVEHPEDTPGKFQQAAAAGKGPDIMIWPHDRAGEWRASGLIAPVDPSPEVQAKLEDIGWEAFTFGGRTWGYPIAIESVGLIYNKELVPDPPETFEEIFALHEELAKEGKRAILWDYTNTYFTWPLLAAHGGYAFGRTADGDYDPTDVGVATPGALMGARMLVNMLEAGVMPRGADYAAMEAEMARGNLGMMITGPWAWENLRKRNIDFGVAPIPSIEGEPGKPFLGVLGAMVNRASPNKDLAAEFLENYVLTMEGLKTLNEDVPLGVPAHKELYRELADDPKIRATMQNVRQGQVMPSLPEMSRFWSAMESALQNIAAGRQPPKEALEGAAERIRG